MYPGFLTIMFCYLWKLINFLNPFLLLKSESPIKYIKRNQKATKIKATKKYFNKLPNYKEVNLNLGLSIFVF